MALLVRRRPRAARLACQSVFLGTRTETEEQQRPRLVIDCGLEYLMIRERELRSLVEQIRMLYYENLGAARPFQLFLTGLGTGSGIHQTLTNNIKNFNDYQIEVTDKPYDSVFNPQDIVYLSPDSEQDLEAVENSKVYIIGGIVDQSSPSKNLTLHRARVAGLQTARLPITRFMEFTTSSPPHNRNLPVNIVTSMLLDVYSGSAWPQVLQRHMPKRKGYRLKSAAAALDLSPTHHPHDVRDRNHRCTL